MRFYNSCSEAMESLGMVMPPEFHAVEKVYPVYLNSYYLSLIDVKDFQNDPIALQAFPHIDELADQEDVERAAAAEMGQDQRPVGVDQAQFGPDHEQGDQRDHGGQQHGTHAQHEQELLAPEAQARKGIAAQGGRHRAAYHRGDDNGHGVFEIVPEGVKLKGLGIVREKPALGQKAGRPLKKLAVGHEAGA